MTGRLAQLIPAILVSLLVASCVVNPVTGDRELGLVSERDEIAIGNQQYAPLKQMQGGEYALDPELIDYVDQVGQRVAAESPRPDFPWEFTVINSSVPNAWALPGGKIAVNRGLLTEFDSEAELAAVLGHEVVHAAARHGAQRMERQLVLQLGLLAIAATTSDSRYANTIVGSAAVGALLISQRYSREAELEADRYGTEYMAQAGYHPMAAAELMETFVRLSEQREQHWLDGMFASHPPSRERLEANRETAERLGSEGEWGRERFRAATGDLERRAPAYAHHDRARTALREGDHEAALQALEKALEIESEEARFHALRGEIRQAQGDLQRAVSDYLQAIEYEPDYFQHHLQAGLVLETRGDYHDARKHLERSLELLPTAPAHLSLGDIERREGNRDKAIDHYRTAASSDSEAGRTARSRLEEMGAET